MNFNDQFGVCLCDFVSPLHVQQITSNRTLRCPGCGPEHMCYLLLGYMWLIVSDVVLVAACRVYDAARDHSSDCTVRVPLSWQLNTLLTQTQHL